LITKRRESASLRQIADALKAGRLACDMAPATLKGIIAGRDARRRAKGTRLAVQRAPIAAQRRRRWRNAGGVHDDVRVGYVDEEKAVWRGVKRKPYGADVVARFCLRRLPRL